MVSRKFTWKLYKIAQIIGSKALVKHNIEKDSLCVVEMCWFVVIVVVICISQQG